MEGTLAAEAGTVAAHTTAAHAAAAGERYTRHSQTQSGCKKHDQKCSVFHGSFSPFLMRCWFQPVRTSILMAFALLDDAALERFTRKFFRNLETFIQCVSKPFAASFV
jgi:hypothetical protein